MGHFLQLVCTMSKMFFCTFKIPKEGGSFRDFHGWVIRPACSVIASTFFLFPFYPIWLLSPSQLKLNHTPPHFVSNEAFAHPPLCVQYRCVPICLLANFLLAPLPLLHSHKENPAGDRSRLPAAATTVCCVGNQLRTNTCEQNKLQMKGRSRMEKMEK